MPTNQKDLKKMLVAFKGAIEDYLDSMDMDSAEKPKAEKPEEKEKE